MGHSRSGEKRLAEAVDRSWYYRAGVEKVTGFCTPQEHQRFLRQCPEFDRMLVDDRVLLRKYWFSVSDVEQERRFRARLDDPTKRWKRSDMDLESRRRFVDFSRAKDEMFVHTDEFAPWWVVDARRADQLHRASARVDPL